MLDIDICNDLAAQNINYGIINNARWFKGQIDLKYAFLKWKKYLGAKIKHCQFAKKCVWKWSRNILSLVLLFMGLK